MATDRSVLTIDLDDPTPAYRQIVNSLRALLVSGAFRQGDRIPTVRQLAVDLGVHHNTVALAYRELAADGWVELRRRRGAVVLKRTQREPDRHALETFERQLEELVAKSVADGVSRKSIAAALKRAAGDVKKAVRRSSGGRSGKTVHVRHSNNLPQQPAIVRPV